MADDLRSQIAGDAASRLARAIVSLEGLSVGDAFGEILVGVSDAELMQRRLPPGPWPWTDDTLMAMSIVEVLGTHEGIVPDRLAASFGARYDMHRGYGPAMHDLLRRFAFGEDWRAAAKGLFYGQGSFGNGAAMRVAPIGAYYADDLARCIEEASLSADITHAHHEARAGAVATAVATALAARRRVGGPSAQPGGTPFVEAVIEHTPDSDVRRGLEAAARLDGAAPVGAAVAELGNGSGITCQDTVPFVCWCAAHHLDDFVEALWLTGAGRGDVDTTCAMVGGIVASSTGRESIPAEWASRREPLPAWPFADDPA